MIPTRTLIASLLVASLLGASAANGAWIAPPAARAPAEPPNANSHIPRDAERLAERLDATRAGLRAALDRWLPVAGRRERTPRDVRLFALDQQRIYILLTRKRRLSRNVIRKLEGDGGAAEARDVLAARRELTALSTPQPLKRFRTGAALPAKTLLRFYKRAERRFDVGWKVLAAVNLVETAFNRLRNKSTAGAQGPMQFIPSTWKAYGMGGDVHDPRDAIMGAANYLHASGAPGNYRKALHAYNPSGHYVEAVLRYARRMRHDRRAYFALHSWEVFVETPSGVKQLTGPGADG